MAEGKSDRPDDEMFDGENEGNPLAFLGLKRVGDDDDTASGNGSAKKKNGVSMSPGGIELNRRGVPARKRKKNSLIYGADDLVSIPVRSPRKRGPKSAQSTPTPIPDEKPEKTPKSKSKNNSTKKRSLRNTPNGKTPVHHTEEHDETPVKKELSTDDLSTPEKKNAQRLGVALRNLLKLPKAHKWVCYEFFYSNVDRVLFEGENDFMVCLRESFPQLKTRLLTRVEWCKIRRMMGKPRRCSPAFFAEERSELTRKRNKIRALQQRKQADVTNFKDLPDDIPLQLTIGARVTARLRKPQDGLFTGTVDAFDTSNNTYRITFDRLGLGTHSVPDYEVLSNDDPEMMPLSSFTAKPRPRPVPTPASITPYLSPMKYGTTYSPHQLANDPLLSGSTPRGKVMRMDGQLGGYPVRFLDQIVRLSKCLKAKRERVDQLRELNCQGEKLKSFGEFIHQDFQKRYASAVIDLANINRNLNEHLKNIQDFTQQFAPEVGPTISLPNMIREGCQEDAYDMVTKSNTSGDREYVENPKILSLVSSLTALMLQIKQIADGERNAFELQALQETLGEIKEGLDNSNMNKFQNSVEIHMQHIQSGLSQLGNLHAFMIPQVIKKEHQ